MCTPHQEIYVQLQALAQATYLLLANSRTPAALRRKLLRFTQELREELPIDAQLEIQAAEAKATIIGAGYLRRVDPDS